VPDKPGYGPWELSADRANAVREILVGEGLQTGHIFMVAGKADTDPLFPDNPSMSPNRRVTITLMREEPPIPTNFSP
jgi:chemotaxis protein MotB